jgi:hypothetical protein
MSFRENPKDFTHYARFYGVLCYARINDDEGLVLAGRNKIWDRLLLVATWFHNAVVERFAQLFAALFNRDYEPGFPIYVQEMEWTTSEN